MNPSPADEREPPEFDPIHDPVLNDPFSRPRLHWRLDRNLRAIDAKPLSGRRRSLALLPVPRDARRASELELDLGDAEENHLVNEIRGAVDSWRNAGYGEVTAITRELLEWWAEGRTRHRLFFAQREAAETTIFLTETRAGRRLARKVAAESRAQNDGIVRWALKMATGTGKTVVMGMLIAWQALNARRSKGRRYSRAFLAIAPGHTVRERLQVLRPSQSDNVYDEFGLVPARHRTGLFGISLAVVNFQAFQRRDLISGSSNVGKGLLRTGAAEDSGVQMTEDAAAMLGRVLRDLRGREKLVVLNDEAHHCYLPAAERQGALGKEDDKTAAVWFNALRSLRDQGRLGPVFDLSATPMFIDTAANKKAKLFPWTVSDFPLLDAIESGLVKIPRLPIDDNAVGQDDVVYRDLYKNTSPKRVKAHQVPEPFRAAMNALYEDYAENFERWEEAGMSTPPVFIIVANNIASASELYRHVAGYREESDDGTVRYVRGALELFSNVSFDGSGFADTPRTLLVHSKLDSDDAISGRLGSEMRELARRLGAESGKFKDVIRETLNSVGRTGRKGEQIRCVISVSMLTEGWDTRTVTHVLGYRAFSTQLLCEQVTGRALRRVNFDNFDENGRFKPEFAEVFGIPFEFMPSRGTVPVYPPPPRYAVESLPGRSNLRIFFPKISGYLIEPGADGLRLDPSLIRRHAVRVEDTPSITWTGGVIGSNDPKEMPILRGQSAVFATAQSASRIFAGDSDLRLAMFRDMVGATEQWLESDLVECENLSLLTHPPHAANVPAAIAKACLGHTSSSLLIGEFDGQAFDSTEGVWFETSLRDWRHAEKSELNRAPCHSQFELRVAEFLDEHRDVNAWVRNFQLGWTVPYVFKSAQREYEPDFVARLFGDSEDHVCVHLMIEVKGVPDEESAAKARYVKDWWIPAVANSAQVPSWLRRWLFVQIDDFENPWRQLDRAIERAREMTTVPSTA